MSTSFETKLRSAAVAGWWTLLSGLVLLSACWFMFLGMSAWRPAWLTVLWGPDLTWPVMQFVAVWFFAAWKFVLWNMLLVVVWLSLWVRTLRSMS